MGGPPTKPPGQTRRRNLDQPGWRTLDPDQGREAPELPDREGSYHERTIEWWDRIWASPMATIWLDSDLGGLFRMADLYDEAVRTGKPHGDLIKLEDRFGLSPKARQMLRWQVGKVPGTGKPEEPPAEVETTPKPKAASVGGTVTRLRAVDAGA